MLIEFKVDNRQNAKGDEPTGANYIMLMNGFMYRSAKVLSAIGNDIITCAVRATMVLVMV